MTSGSNKHNSSAKFRHNTSLTSGKLVVGSLFGLPKNFPRGKLRKRSQIRNYLLHRECSYYSVLQSTTPVLLCTTKYYSSTTLNYKVLLRTTQYYSSTTPYYKVLLCTTKYYKYYSRTTLYYKVLYTPVLLCTTKYYSHD